MENEMQIFECEEFGKVRTFQDDDGRILFCGKDVATALGYRDTVNALKSHCKEDGVGASPPHRFFGQKTVCQVYF